MNPIEKRDHRFKDDYSYSQVFFQDKKPVLNSELNLLQEIQDSLYRRGSSQVSSGWFNFRSHSVSKDILNSFYTQDPSNPVPEMAVVNGWPIYVTNTGTSVHNLNKIQLDDSELKFGTRVDGIFLEVWRSKISSQSVRDMQDTVRPQPSIKIGSINDIFMYNEDIGIAVGENSTLLRTEDGGQRWFSIESPVDSNFNSVDFLDKYIGFAVGDKGSVIKTINGGFSWNAVEVNESRDLNGVKIINKSRVCIVGDAGLTLISEDGSTFRSSFKTTSTVKNLNSLYFHDAFVGWAVGAEGTLLSTRDGGNSWDLISISEISRGTSITDTINSVVFFNMNDGLISCDNGKMYRTSDSGYSWSDVSDRVWKNEGSEGQGSFKNLSDLYPGVNLNKISIKKEYPINFTIEVADKARSHFKNLSYKISPSDSANSLVLDYTGIHDGISYRNTFYLNQYDSAEELKEAIAAVESPYLSEDSHLPDEDRKKITVFKPTIDYAISPSDFKPLSGSFSSLNPANISFSVEDKVWIVGDNGVVIHSKNSGSKWDVVELDTRSKLNSVFYIEDRVGWFVGDNGTIIKNDSVEGIEDQSTNTDLISKVRGRIYPYGNILSEAEDFLPDDIIDSRVGIETSKRIQVQYRIRVVTGINPNINQEAGLGQSTVYSLGPNERHEEAGSYIFENMGKENGDYGLWRARCRNTYDDYTWAIPMFFVTRKNSSPFNIEGNINGSTRLNLGSLRPDGLSYNQIHKDEIIDLRRDIKSQSSTTLMERNFEKLLSNKLSTNIGDRSSLGSQFGATVFAMDRYTGNNDILRILNGELSSRAILKVSSKSLNPYAEEPIVESDLVFDTLSNGLYHNDISYYSAYEVRTLSDEEISREEIAGTFEGIGTNRVVFIPNEDDFFERDVEELEPGEEVRYELEAHYLDYNSTGLSRVPEKPISVRYQSSSTNPALYFNGIDAWRDNRVLERFPEVIESYADYTVLHSAKDSLHTEENKELYNIGGNIEVLDKGTYKRSKTRFKNQQFMGSLVEYHHFIKIPFATNVIRVPKNLNGHSVLGVRSIRNLSGSTHRINIDFEQGLTIIDREKIGDETNKENIVIHLDPASTVASATILEVVLEVVVDSSVLGGDSLDTGFTSVDAGDRNLDSLRTSLVSKFNKTSKGVEGLYAGILYRVAISSSSNSVEINLEEESSINSLVEAKILGISSNAEREGIPQHYIWYKSETYEDGYYSHTPIRNVEGLGTSKIRVNFHENMDTTEGGEILIPMLVKLRNLPSLGNNSSASVFYRYNPYQTIGRLPNTLSLEIMKTSDFIYVTNLGTGSDGRTRGEPYEIPTEHIPINDLEISSDNYFSNSIDLDFSNLSISTGFAKLPSYVSQYVGEEITLSSPVNSGDNLGRPFYKECSYRVVSEAEPLTLGMPRKVMIPMLAKIKSNIITPFIKNELVLVVFNKTYKVRKDNKTGFYEDLDTEIIERRGLHEYADTSISIYRLDNKPLTRD